MIGYKTEEDASDVRYHKSYCRSKQEYIPVGVEPSGGVCLGMCLTVGVSAWGCLSRWVSARGVFVQTGVCPGRVSVYLPQWTAFLTHACKTLPFHNYCCGKEKRKTIGGGNRNLSMDGVDFLSYYLTFWIQAQ